MPRFHKFSIRVPVVNGQTITRHCVENEPHKTFRTDAWDIEVTGAGSAQIEGRVYGHDEFRIIDTLANEGSVWHRSQVNAFKVTASGGDVVVTFSSRES